MDTPYRQRRRIVPVGSIPPTSAPQPRTPLAQLSSNAGALRGPREALDPAPSSAVKTLRIAFQDTPPRLKQLEGVWRRRRAAKLEAVAGEGAPAASTSAVTGAAVAHPHARRVRFGRSDDTPLEVVAPEVHTGGVSSLAESDVSLAQAPQPSVPGSRHAGFPPTPPSSPPPPVRKLGGSEYLVESSSRKPPSDTRSGRAPPESCEATPAPAPRIRSLRLPPTNTPIVLGSSGDTLVVHQPDHHDALFFSLQGGLTRVRVSHDGGVASVSTTRGGQRVRFTLRHADQARWSALERRLWYRLVEMLETAEARTPRVKLFTSLGDIVVTCSDPPDIILSFSHNTGLDESVVPDEAGTRRKARGRYSRKHGTVTLDTASKSANVGVTGSSTLRTRRTVQLGRIEEGKESRTGPAALGIVAGDDWTELELEAVCRLWRLRDEWEQVAW